MITPDRDLLNQLLPAAHEAGAAIMTRYGQVSAEAKADGSPITEADHVAEVIILEALAEISPGVIVVAEEAVTLHGLPPLTDEPFWLVDPLDGTKEFLDQTGDFTVNIALVADGQPVLGLIHAPFHEQTYFGLVNEGAWRVTSPAGEERICTRAPSAAGLDVVVSRSHGRRDDVNRFLRALPVARRRLVGSSYKFCLIAAGEADLYPRFGPTSEWDTAAGQAILQAAGGSVTRLDGAPLDYGKPGLLNPAFIASGRRLSDRLS